MNWFRAPVALLAGILLFGSCGQVPREVPQARDNAVYVPEPYIEARLDSAEIGQFLDGHDLYQPYDSLIRDFYRKRDFHLAWFSRDSLTEQVGNFMNMMRQNQELGLVSDSGMLNPKLGFMYDSLAAAGGRAGNERIMRDMELLLTAQFFHFAGKLWGGMTSAEAKDLEWFIPRKKMDMNSLINSMLEHKAAGIGSFAPVHPQYGMLRKELQRLEELSSGASWDSLRLEVKAYKPGDSAALIAQLKQRLALLGFGSDHDSSGLYTEELDSLVAEYRLCNGLKTGGKVDRELVNDLNVPLKDKAKKILVNMERLRWVPDTPGDYYLLVNIPGFMLYAYEQDSLMWSMPVVVGKPVHQTVIFSGLMRYVVFSPYWNIPPGILANETLPAIKRDPSYLRRNAMEVVRNGKVVDPSTIDWQRYRASNFPYMIRQKPGGSNALGRVKFLFPNEYNIYLHDTPSKSHFSADSRSFSHGCIRVSKPAELAEYLLRSDSSWTARDIQKAMQSGKEKYVTLKNPVRVYIGYFTAWVDSKGRLNFRPDVYGHDAKLSELLFGKRESI